MGHSIKIDLHTHSCYSHDAFITIKHYEYFFRRNPDFILAITDHNEIEGALQCKKAFGEKIIIGEEVKTAEGELIGLYLDHCIDPGMPLENTVEEIKKQDGLVMVPHPFKRTGNSDSQIFKKSLCTHLELFDIIEIYNSRNRTEGANEQALAFARSHQKPMAVGTDAHAFYELGKAFMSIPAYNGRTDLLDQLAAGHASCRPVGFFPRLLTRVQRELKRSRK
jgi:predicted metal-dependent phosphoesterase TrpH